jgi:hypothetical protein
MSLAHFLSAPRVVAESIDGLSTPTDANDETYFDVEPVRLRVRCTREPVMTIVVAMIDALMNCRHRVL